MRSGWVSAWWKWAASPPEQLDQALDLQHSKGGRVGEPLAELGFISTTTARFFSLAKVNEKGQIYYQAG